MNVNNFALVGMAGVISANLHAPLTAIFLIGDITDGYKMFIPLIITSVFAYTTVKIFLKNSVYTIQLEKRGELMTHNQDQNILKMMNINKLIETNFLIVKKEDTLGELTKIISKSSRNIFPVVGENNKLEGIIILDQIKEIIFDREKYDKVKVSELMMIPQILVNIDDNMDDVANKFKETNIYNIPVVDAHKNYVGFISKANMFSTYRKMLKYFAED